MLIERKNITGRQLTGGYDNAGISRKLPNVLKY